MCHCDIGYFYFLKAFISSMPILHRIDFVPMKM